MDLDPKIYKELIAIFNDELNEQLDALAQQLAVLKEEQDKAKIDKAIVILHRIAHTIKGSAQSVGIDAVGQVAARMEVLFGTIKEGKLPVSQDVIDACLAAADTIDASMTAFLEDNSQVINTQSIESQLSALTEGKSS